MIIEKIKGVKVMEEDRRKLQIGEAYTMNFSGYGNEQRGIRPGLVFQNNLGNVFSPNIIALPLTSSIKKIKLPTHVTIISDGIGLKKDSVVLCENPERMSKSRIGKYITTLSHEQMKQVVSAYVLATSAIAFLDRELLLSLWEKSILLNFHTRNQYERVGGYV